jgi:hypothetical protein
MFIRLRRGQFKLNCCGRGLLKLPKRSTISEIGSGIKGLLLQSPSVAEGNRFSNISISNVPKIKKDIKKRYIRF